MSEKNSYKIDQIVNSIFEGDCIEIMKQFPDNCIDMILCDLPYGTTQNKWDSIIPLDELCLFLISLDTFLIHKLFL